MLFGFSSVSCVLGVCLFLWSSFCVQDLGYLGVPPAGHALWAKVGGSLTFVITGGNVRQLINSPAVIFGFMIISSMGSHIC